MSEAGDGGIIPQEPPKKKGFLRSLLVLEQDQQLPSAFRISSDTARAVLHDYKTEPHQFWNRERGKVVGIEPPDPIGKFLDAAKLLFDPMEDRSGYEAYSQGILAYVAMARIHFTSKNIPFPPESFTESITRETALIMDSLEKTSQSRLFDLKPPHDIVHYDKEAARVLGKIVDKESSFARRFEAHFGPFRSDLFKVGVDNAWSFFNPQLVPHTQTTQSS